MIIETEVSKESSLPRIFPYLYNIKDFINRSHPQYHPETTKYDQYWSNEEKKCIEGIWGDDFKDGKGGKRFCPGALYYYVNYCVIEDELQSENRSEVINPQLRDIEWVFFYNWIIARGFSGFDQDPNYTSNLLVKKIEDGVELSPKDKIRLKTFKHIYKADGTLKKYVHPREYLYNTHETELGLPVYENSAKNLLGLTSRGAGKSFWLMGVISHTFKFHGAIRYDSSYHNIEKGPEMVVGSVANKAADMLNKFKFNEEYQKNNFGAWGENEDFMPGYFFTMVSGSLSVSNSKSPYRAEYEFKEGRVTKKGGVGTKILHVTYEDNPEASVGTRPIVSIIEEVGLMTNLLQVHACYGKDTKVRMYDTTLKNVQEIEVGDEIMGHDGSIRTVKNVYSGYDDLYMVKQRGSIDYIVNSKHNIIYRDNTTQYTTKNLTATPEELLNIFSKNKKKGIKGVKSGSLEFNKKDLTLDPYYMGVFIGDGVARNGGIVIQKCNETEILSNWIRNYFKSLGLETSLDLRDDCPLYRPSTKTNKGGYKRNYILNQLRKYDTFDKKYIHPDFLTSSRNDRLQLLAGIIDTDGTYCNRKKGRSYVIHVAGREQLVDSIIFLATSLGFKTSVCIVRKNKEKHKTPRHITISGPIHEIPCKIPHKIASNNTYSPTDVQGMKVEYIGKGEYFGFELEEHPWFLGQDNTILSNSNETTLIRQNKFGSALYVGTAGNLEKILPTKTIFEDPDSYDMLDFPDLWENRQKPIGLFIPAYYTDNTFRDENGNQDVVAAYEDIMAIRAKKAKAEDNFALAGWVMARPIKPSEMFLSGISNRFPLAQIQEHFTNIETQGLFERFSSKGILKRIDRNKVVFISDINNDLKPIKDTMIDRIIDKKGAIVFYEHPESNIPDPTIKRSLYKICYDPVNHDIDGTSLASIIVYKAVSENDWANGLKDDIVAEFIGRRNLVDEVHDIAINLAIYYNARVLVETNVPDFIRYCRRENFTHLLQATPHDTISKVVYTRTKKYDVGVDMASPALHEHAEQLLNQWLLTAWKTDEDGRELLNLHKIKSPRILLELMQYDPMNRNKSDHIASLKLLMLWLAQDKIDPIKNPIENIKEEVALFINRVANRKHIVNVFHNY